MNWRRGLVRLWVIISGLWVVVIGSFAIPPAQDLWTYWDMQRPPTQVPLEDAEIEEMIHPRPACNPNQDDLAAYFQCQSDNLQASNRAYQAKEPAFAKLRNQQEDFKKREYAREQLITIAGWTVVPPILAAVLAVLMLWVARGFARETGA